MTCAGCIRRVRVGVGVSLVRGVCLFGWVVTAAYCSCTCFWCSYTPPWCELTRTEFEHVLVSRTPCSHSYKISLSLKFVARAAMFVWFAAFGVGVVQSWTVTLVQSMVPPLPCAALVSRIVSPISGASVSASIPPSALRCLCRGSPLCVRSFCMLFTAASTPFHSFSLPTPAMLSRLSGSCGRGGSVGAGRSGSLFAHGSGMSRSRSGSSCANLRVLYAGSVLAVLCDAFASAACPVSGAGLAMFCHFCGEPMTSSCSAAVTSAPCRNSTGRHVPCRLLLLHCC